MAPRQDSIKTLSNIARILQKSQPSENPLAHITGMVREQLSVDVCSLYLLQDKTLILVATDGLDPGSIGHVRMEVKEGLTGLAVEKLQPIIVQEASAHPRFKYFPSTGEEKFRSFAAVPLLDRETVVGVLTIQTTAAREFSVQEIELLRLIAFQLAPLVQNLVTLEILQREEKREGRHLQLQGIAVAPGFGIGPAFFLKTGVSPVIPPLAGQKTGQPAEEWKKMGAALKKTTADLLRLEKRLRKKFSKNESDIFYSHRMILSDKTFLKKLKAELKPGVGAAEGVAKVIGGYIRELEKIEDPHFRERAADLEDLRQRMLDHLYGEAPKREKEKWEGILVADTLVPSDTARLDPKKISGIVTARGGVTSHAAILARSLGIPAVMGVSGALSRIQPGNLLIVDGDEGKVYVDPERDVLLEYEKIQERNADRLLELQRYAAEPALTLDGRRIHLEANVGLISDLKRLPYFGAEGVGLYRTEFPFMMRKKLPDEEEQFQLYRKIIQEADGLPITFRILDAGGDKPIEVLSTGQEPNPFLGYRSIRLFMARPEILEVQFRALLRASAFGPVRLLVPMISGMEELFAVKKILEAAKQNLKKRGLDFDPQIPFGIMIEVPSAVALVHHLIREVDFLSLGTNDLIQYTLAVDRNNEKVAAFFEPLHPAVLHSIARVAQVGSEAGKSVGVCGEMAGDPAMTPLLVGLGITQLSMIAPNIPLVKKAIRGIEYGRAKAVAEKALLSATAQEAKDLLAPLREKIALDQAG